MKSVILLLALISICSAACRKDLVRWRSVEKIDIPGSADRLNRIYFIDDTTGFVVGGQRFFNSTILRTDDGGKTWNYHNLNEAPKGLYNITQAPDKTLYAIGFDGKLLRSDDRGLNWSFHQLWYLPYKDIAFFSPKRGLAIGGISFYTGCKTYVNSDGTYAPWDSLVYELNDIEMINEKEGYIAGYGLVMKTEDSGYNWHIQSVENDNFTSIRTYGRYEAWTCGYNGSIFHTTDGGKSWKRMRDGNDFTKRRYRLLDIAFTDRLHGYAVGENGIFLYSDDGGHHWMEFEKFTDDALRCIVAREDGSLLVCGDNAAFYRVVPQPL